MSVCSDCKSTFPSENVIAHFGWCKQVGGPGYHPRSWQGLQDEYYRQLEAQARREAEKAAAAAAEAERQASNNGWIKYNGAERTYDHLTDVSTPRPLDVLVSALDVSVRRARMRDSSPVARHTEDGYLTRPGKELPKYWRSIAIKLVDEQGWTYRYKRKGGHHPRLIPPAGGAGVGLPTTVTDGDAGHRAAYLGALKRAGAVLDAA
jgi:hypothetical protein